MLGLEIDEPIEGMVARLSEKGGRINGLVARAVGVSNIDKDGQRWHSRAERPGGMPVNVHLTPELETLVQNKVKRGRYNSASEVVREALRLFEERDRIRGLQIQELRKKINQGWASLEHGEGVDGEAFFRALRREERALARKRKRQ